MESVLAQALYQATPVSNWTPVIAFLVPVVLLYLVFAKKDRRVIELLTTQKLLVPIGILLALALSPASVMAIFGSVQNIMMAVVQLITAVFIPTIITAGVVYLIGLVNPKALE